MNIARVSSKGQIVIPKALRDSHGIHAGDRFIVSSVGKELRLMPAPAAEPVSLQAVAGMLRHARTKTLSQTEIEKRIGDQLLADDLSTK